MDCSLCCESFTEDGPHTPRTLDCGHTFCTRCIQMLDRTANSRQAPRCPECRDPIRTHRRPITAFPKNYKLLELIRDRTEPSPKPGADTSEDYRDHRGLDATDPASYSSNLEEDTTLGGEPPGFVGEDSELFFGINWSRSRPMHRRDRPLQGTPHAFHDWAEIGWQQRAPPQANSNPPNSELWLYGFDPPTTVAATVGSGSSSGANRAGSGGSVVRTTAGGAPQAPQPTALSGVMQDHIANGRAVQGSNGSLICKFYQEGTCRYGPHCWFQHPCINPTKALCKHWQKGQCRMGMVCNFRHGTLAPMRPRNRNRNRANRSGNPPAGASDGAPGPSGSGGSSTMVVGSSTRCLNPNTTVVLVSENSVSIRTGLDMGPEPSASAGSVSMPASSTMNASRW